MSVPSRSPSPLRAPLSHLSPTYSSTARQRTASPTAHPRHISNLREPYLSPRKPYIGSLDRDPPLCARHISYREEPYVSPHKPLLGSHDAHEGPTWAPSPTSRGPSPARGTIGFGRTRVHKENEGHGYGGQHGSTRWQISKRHMPHADVEYLQHVGEELGGLRARVDAACAGTALDKPCQSSRCRQCQQFVPVHASCCP